jgi:hypothetical protein
MRDADPCSDTLSAAVAAFTRRGTVEPGLDVDGEALLQLRKACRILDGIRALRDIDRHYTLVVEGSFAALERTVQFYVVDRELAATAELLNHEDTFAYGVQAGVFSSTPRNIPFFTLAAPARPRSLRSRLGHAIDSDRP